MKTMRLFLMVIIGMSFIGQVEAMPKKGGRRGGKAKAGWVCNAKNPNVCVYKGPIPIKKAQLEKLKKAEAGKEKEATSLESDLASERKRSAEEFSETASAAGEKTVSVEEAGKAKKFAGKEAFIREKEINALRGKLNNLIGKAARNLTKADLNEILLNAYLLDLYHPETGANGRRYLQLMEWRMSQNPKLKHPFYGLNVDMIHAFEGILDGIAAGQDVEKNKHEFKETYSKEKGYADLMNTINVFEKTAQEIGAGKEEAEAEEPTEEYEATGAEEPEAGRRVMKIKTGGGEEQFGEAIPQQSPRQLGQPESAQPAAREV